MKTKLAMLLSLSLLASAGAQVTVLPPGFTLFGKTSADFLVEYDQALFPLSTNEDFSFPKAVPSANDPVYFLHRPSFGVIVPSLIQTYFVPDNVYVYLAVFYYANDNVGVAEPLPIPLLQDGLHAAVDGVTELHAIIDGVAVSNLFAYRTESPAFSIFFPNTDNFYSVLGQQPYEGLDDPVVAEGFLLMLAPLPVGVHDFHTGATVGQPIGIVYERHYQIVVYHTNSPPVADASGTQGRVISPNNRNAKVVLDGSRSSDPGNDLLTYSWLEGDSPIASGVLATNVLPIGSHVISLVVNDGTLSATNTITVDVATACEAIAELGSELEAAQLPHKKLKSLVEDLREACESFERGFRQRHHEQEEYLEHGIEELQEFQKQVERFHLDQALAGDLVSGAQEIIDALKQPRHHEGGHKEKEHDDHD